MKASIQITKCYEELLPLFAKAKGRKLTKKQEQSLLLAIEEAHVALKGVIDYLNPKENLTELRQKLDELTKQSQDLNKKFGSLARDDRVITALNTAYDIIKTEWSDHALGHLGTGVDAYIQLSEYLAFASQFAAEIKDSMPIKRGAATNYRQLAFLPLIEAWVQIVGKYPGITGPKLNNIKTGTFVSAVQIFFKHFDLNHRISGDTIQAYLNELKPAFFASKPRARLKTIIPPDQD